MRKTAVSKTPEPARRRGNLTGPRGIIPPRPERPIDVTGVYDFDEAAGYLRISRRAVGRLIEAGRLGYLPVNQKNRRVLGRHLLDFQERSARGARR